MSTKNKLLLLTWFFVGIPAMMLPSLLIVGISSALPLRVVPGSEIADSDGNTFSEIRPVVSTHCAGHLAVLSYYLFFAAYLAFIAQGLYLYKNNRPAFAAFKPWLIFGLIGLFHIFVLWFGTNLLGCMYGSCGVDEFQLPTDTP